MLKMEIIDPNAGISEIVRRATDALLDAQPDDKKEKYKAALAEWQKARGIE